MLVTEADFIAAMSHRGAAHQYVGFLGKCPSHIVKEGTGPSAIDAIAAGLLRFYSLPINIGSPPGVQSIPPSRSFYDTRRLSQAIRLYRDATFLIFVQRCGQRAPARETMRMLLGLPAPRKGLRARTTKFLIVCPASAPPY